jgi:NADH:quinone reductase (non-electrogenic)
MSEPRLFNTRITELLGIRLPVLAAGLQWLSNADYVAAAVNAGLMGFLTAASYPDPASLRAEIRRCRKLLEGRPFGVNVSMLPKHMDGDRAADIFSVVVDEGVPFVETSGSNPELYLPRLRDAGIKVIHKVPAVRFARKAESIGVDAVIVVGSECGGHPGLQMVGTMVQAVTAARSLSIPLVIGGGIGTGSQLVAALAMGADGVAIGTRFLVATEIGAHPDYKRRMVEAGETDTALILQSVRNTMRVLRNETAEAVQRLEAEGEAGIETLYPLVAGEIGRQAYETGDTSRGALSMGQSVAFADAVEPLAAIVRRIEEEAREAMNLLTGKYVEET